MKRCNEATSIWIIAIVMLAFIFALTGCSELGKYINLPQMPAPVPTIAEEEATLFPEEEYLQEPGDAFEPEGETGFPGGGQLAQVESIEIMVSGNLPVELNVAARGSLPDKCSSIDQARTIRNGNIFQVELTIKQTSTGECEPVAVAFEEKIPLDVKGLPAGLYTVDVNGVIGTFEFAMDNVAEGQRPGESSAPSETGRNSISGVVWHDLCAVSTSGKGGAGCVAGTGGKYNANGRMESGETGIGGVTVTLKEGDCQAEGTKILQTITTDEKGKYSFKSIPSGTFCVQVNAADQNNKGKLYTGAFSFPSADGHAKVVLKDGGEKTGVNFGWDFLATPVAAQPTSAFQFEPGVQPPLGLTPVGGYYPSGIPGYGTPYPAPYGPSGTCLNAAAIVSEANIPSGPSYQAGMNVVKTWRLRNTGTCVWRTGYSLVFVGGDQLNASPSTLTGDVAPNATVDMSVQIQTPMITGNFNSQWMLRSDSGAVFGLGEGGGQPLSAIIQVSGYTIFPTPQNIPGQAGELRNLGQPTWIDYFWNDSNWYMVNDENTYWQVRDGGLYMTARKEVDVDRWGLSRQPAMQDFYLEMEARTGPVCAGFDSYGIVFRAQDNDSGYVFGVTCNGSYRLYQWDHGYFKSIQPYTATEHLKTGSYRTNRIGVMAIGEKMRLYVNGFFIGEYESDWFRHGQFGLMIGPNQTENMTIIVKQVAFWLYR